MFFASPVSEHILNNRSHVTHSMVVCKEHGMDPSRVAVDYDNEQVVQETLDGALVRPYQFARVQRLMGMETRV